MVKGREQGGETCSLSFGTIEKTISRVRTACRARAASSSASWVLRSRACARPRTRREHARWRGGHCGSDLVRDPRSRGEQQRGRATVVACALESRSPPCRAPRRRGGPAPLRRGQDKERDAARRQQRACRARRMRQ
jgi:hypothetical protein